MTSPGRYASSDGSFARSAGGAAARGGILIAIAVVIGVLLLWQGFDGGEPTAAVEAGDDAGADGNGGTSADDAGDDGAGDDSADDAGDDGAGDDGAGDDAAGDDAAGDDSADDAGGDGAGDDTGDVEGDDGAPSVVVDPPETVKVAVANGRGEPGLGSARAEVLTTAGYVAVGVNAANFDHELSRVYYTAGYEDEAKQVADVLGGGASVLDMAPADPLALVEESFRESVTDFHIYVVLGADGVLG